MIYLSLKNNKDIQIDTDNYDLLREIKDRFTWKAPNYYWTPSYQSGAWDGKTSIFSQARRSLPYGLFLDLYKLLKKLGYTDLSIDDDIKNLFISKDEELDIKYDLKFYPYDYQQECIEDAFKKTKGIYRVGTGGGKSLIIAYIIKTLFENKRTDKHIIIVPTISLIDQFKGDLIEYGIDKDLIGIANKDKREFDKNIVVSTWQTLNNRKDKLKEFDLVVCDETHKSKAPQIQKIMAACSHMKYIYGVTGTLPDHPLEKARILSYIGPVWKEFNAKWLADNGYLSHCKIKQIKIKYNKSHDGDYNDIKKEIFKNEYRLKIIKSIVKKNDFILILVERVEDEGIFLKEYLEENVKDRKIVFISGKDKSDVREKWRKEMEKDGKIVLIATYGIFSTGINIKSLKNLIIASSSKSKIRVLQSIGRSLRKHENKDLSGANIWDLNDQVKMFQRHGNSRDRFYINEKFEIQEIEMNEKIDKNLNKLFVPALD